MYNFVDLDVIDLSNEAPATEPERQYYFMKKAKVLVERESQNLGHKLTANITTFG